MHHHDHDHHSHVDPAFELVESDCHQCGEHSAPHFNIECGHEHRIFGVNITHKPGDFIYWDSELELYVPAVEDKCDLMVLRVDHYGTWFEAANIGEFQLKNFTLKGPVYIDYVGELTNTETNTKIGFIENGHLYLSIQPTSSGGGGTPYTLPVATTSVLGGVTTAGISEQVGLILKPQASNPSTIVDGQMFAKADGLYVQIGGVLYKVNLTPA